MVSILYNCNEIVFFSIKFYAQVKQLGIEIISIHL